MENPLTNFTAVCTSSCETLCFLPWADNYRSGLWARTCLDRWQSRHSEQGLLTQVCACLSASRYVLHVAGVFLVEADVGLILEAFKTFNIYVCMRQARLVSCVVIFMNEIACFTGIHLWAERFLRRLWPGVTNFKKIHSNYSIYTCTFWGKNTVIFCYKMYPFISRWWMGRPRAGWFWTSGNPECHHWANLCNLPGSHVLPPGRNTLGIRVSACGLPLSFGKICRGFRLLWQSGQNKNLAPFQTNPVNVSCVAGVSLSS